MSISGARSIASQVVDPNGSLSKLCASLLQTGIQLLLALDAFFELRQVQSDMLSEFKTLLSATQEERHRVGRYHPAP